MGNLLPWAKPLSFFVWKNYGNDDESYELQLQFFYKTVVVLFVFGAAHLFVFWFYTAIFYTPSTGSGLYKIKNWEL